ncbi:MAG: hypothetical protein RIQ60_2636 [Pseudomonadota bacterium]|jgi:putative addiction module component (TIGR02574 family)
MPTSLELLEAEAMKLPEAQRLLLAERLFQSTETAAPLDPAWEEEIRRRIKQVDTGEVSSRPWDEAMAELRTRFG